MNREIHVRICEGLGGEIPPGLLDPRPLQRLKTLRRSLADAQNVPAYIVFSDAVLRALVDRRPRTREEMLAVPGIGPAKLARYGDDFLKALSADPNA